MSVFILIKTEACRKASGMTPVKGSYNENVGLTCTCGVLSEVSANGLNQISL